jgi:anti-anti-sigma factor
MAAVVGRRDNALLAKQRGALGDARFRRGARRTLQGIFIGAGLMAPHRRLQLTEVGDVSVIRFVDRKILDEANIQELGQELFQLIEEDERKNLLLNFSSVEFLSSAALGKLITLDKKVKAHSGKLKLSNIRPEIYEVFAITKLNKLFDIKDDEADALASF